MTVVQRDRAIDAVEARTCYLCGEEGRRVQSELRDTWLEVPGAWSLRRCAGCDLVWLDPLPRRTEIARLYGDGYHTHSPPADTATAVPGIVRRVAQEAMKPAAPKDGVDASTPRAVERAAIRGLRRLASVRDVADGSVMWVEPCDGDLLDVGCGNGAVLVRQRDRGWTVHGLEPDSAAARVAIDHHGLDVTCGTIEENVLPGDRFDVVTMSHVIEHVHDPIEALRECARLLKPGGRLVVVTPNVHALGRSWYRKRWLGWDVPRHLYVFSRRSLRRCAEAAGLEIRELRTTARTCFRQTPSMDRFIRLQRQSSTGDRARARALLFWLVEHAASRLMPCGEEILLIARRPR